MTRLREDVRGKSWFADKPENENTYNKKIYIKSDWKAPEASGGVEQKMNALEYELRKLQQLSMQR